MAQEDDHTRTIVYAERALDFLRQHALPAYPRFYEVWYTYAAGFNHALNKAVNDVSEAAEHLSSENVQEIYNQFLSPNRLGDRIDKVGTKLSAEIRDMLDRLSQNSDMVSEYGSSLEGARIELENLESPAQLSALVTRLLKATTDTAHANSALERQLIESHEQIESLRESLEAIRHESVTDELTTLYNRKHFDQSIERMMRHAADTKEPLSLLITDIDHFKRFNDSYGHQTGDQVLRLVAVASKQNVKGKDIPCRYGGEEFAILMPHTTLQQALSVAEQIRRAVMSKELVKRSTGENLGRITITIGAATMRGDDTAHSFIARADKALYAGKHGGRNQVRSESDLDGSKTAPQVA